MKQFKSLMALLLSLIMVFSVVGAALAAEGVPADTSISVSGLQTGDKVNFYQVLKYDETATATGGWVANTGFTDLSTGDIQKIVGKGDYAVGGTKASEAGIDAALAGRISVMAQAAGVTAKFANVEESSGTATQATTNVGDAGLYIALVTPGTPDYLYNPVFVAADYTAGGTNTMAAATTLSYEPASLAKKEQITLTKEIDGTTDAKYDVDVGDEVSFTITSKVPAYSSAYQEPTYIITDTMESGLELKDNSIQVAIDGLTGDDALTSSDYTVTPADNKLSFTVAMTAAGLAKVTKKGTAQEIVVTYTATVTSLENFTVSEKENEATVKFSNNPDDSTSYSLLEDKTRTYSFTIDGSLLGYTGESYETDELIKTGKNADGSWITETKKYHSATKFTDLAPLSGAKFAIFKSEPAAADYANEAAAKASSKIYTNNVETDGIIESDANGRIKIQGLDAGDYWLREVSAPTGYIADDRTFHITIAAEYDTINGGEYTNTDGIKVKYDAYKVLKSYTVTVNDGTGSNVSTYNIENKGPNDHKVVDKATYQAITGEGDWAGDNVTPINNTKGTSLPATGGIGTTIFYVAGIVLVLGAAAVIIARRKAEQE